MLAKNVSTNVHTTQVLRLKNKEIVWKLHVQRPVFHLLSRPLKPFKDQGSRIPQAGFPRDTFTRETNGKTERGAATSHRLRSLSIIIFISHDPCHYRFLYTLAEATRYSPSLSGHR